MIKHYFGNMKEWDLNKMTKEELNLYMHKSCENILKKLAENPDEMLNLSDLQEKYNNLLKEKIELKRQIKKQNEVINKAIKYINENVFLDDNGCGNYWWEIADKDKLLDILKEVKR